jgi:fused signal recognition particle receptor
MLGWFKKKKKKKEKISATEDIGTNDIGFGQEEDFDEPASAIKGIAVEGAIAIEEPAISDIRDDEQGPEIPAVEMPDAQAPENVADSSEPEHIIQQRVPAEQKKDSLSLFRRLQQRLSKTRSSLVYRLDTLFLGKKEIDQELFDDLEEILITADLGVMTTQELLDDVRKEVRRKELKDPQVLKGLLQEKILAYLRENDVPAEMIMPETGPFVIMVVGVNGVGKTTSIGKIAAKFVRSGHSVLLIAGDTFRAAAIDQLKIWGERVGVEVVAQKQGADPSSVVYDGIEYGTARKFDVIIIDTAGRLHTQVNLMEELKKIKRVIAKKLENAPHEVMLVLDATTGQNGISQAKLFNDAVTVTGITLTKLDGTAKGGIVVNICRELNIPVRFIGIGEQIDDLRDFDTKEFVDALFKTNGGNNQEVMN